MITVRMLLGLAPPLARPRPGRVVAGLSRPGAGVVAVAVAGEAFPPWVLTRKQRVIWGALLEAPATSRDLADELALSRSYVTALLARWTSEGRVRECGRAHVRTGVWARVFCVAEPGGGA